MIQAQAQSGITRGQGGPAPRYPGSLPWWRRGAKWLRRTCGPWLGVHDQYRHRPLVVPESYRQVATLAKPPLISVVTPSFNQGRFLEQTILSVLQQNYPALQYIVQDGGSDDETADILEKYRGQLSHVEARKDTGQSQAINRGFRHGTGAILAYLNSDDLLLPGALGYVAQFFVGHPEVDVVYGHRVVIDERGEEVGRWVMPPHEARALIWNDYIPQETLFWRRSIWDKVGAGMEENLHFALDWDLLMRFHKVGARFARLPRFLGAFRIHAQQKTTAYRLTLSLPEQKSLRDRFHDRQVSRGEVWFRVLPFLSKHVFYQRLYQLGILHY